MILRDRVDAFKQLGRVLSNFHNTSNFKNIILKAENNNNWFTQRHIEYAILSLGYMLRKDNLMQFISSYDFCDRVKKVGVIIPSNIPLVGFYDFLCVLLSGHIFIGKLSKSNNVLLPFIANLLCGINMGFKSKIDFQNQLSNVDIVIATGGDNSAVNFEYLFRDQLRLIRKNRNSIAILSGSESVDDYNQLASDIFLYFGLGCRNVSKIFIPNGFNINDLKQAFSNFDYTLINKNYSDNYHYQKTILRMQEIDFFDFDNVLLVESKQINSPIAVLYYEYYDTINSICKFLDCNDHIIQCVVSSTVTIQGSIRLGSTQKPSLYDFPDGLDVIQFLNA